MAKDLLFEIGIEEIPARFMAPALKQIEDIMTKKLAEAGLEYKAMKTYGTPRRFTLIVEDLAEMQADIVVESKGPAKKAAFDADGNPTKALQGFCRGKGVEIADLVEKEIKNVPYMYAVKEVKGQKTADIIAEMLHDMVGKIYFPKPMRWGYGEMRFARPIRWVVLLLGEELLPINLGGVESGRYSRGHRFLGSQQVEIKNAAAYEEALAKEFVIVDQDKRREEIWKQVQAVAEKAGGMVKEDKDLLEEVVYILEYPTALLGDFDKKYLSMPVELIVTPMREHQRYFPVYAKDGSLMNHFIAVRNGNDEHLDIVKAGNEKVLVARLADAVFFWEEDCKKPLEENLPRLQSIVFHEKLGTLAAKVERVCALADYIGKKLGYGEEDLANTARAGKLMKCDLVSSAVFEFTELQGIMGKYYAEVHNEPADVAAAIKEHYMPRFAGDELAQTKPGIALAIADRLDSMVGFFGQQMLPTGSQDPYALRRQANGICQTIIRHELDLSLAELIEESYKLYANVKMVSNAEETKAALLTFFKSRLDTVLGDEGVSYDVANAVLCRPVDNLKEIFDKAQAIKGFKASDKYEDLTAGYNRANNMLAKVKEFTAVDKALFKEDAEKSLYAGLTAAEAEAEKAMAANDYQKALNAAAALRTLIDGFFDNVMIMDKDENVKNNRLALLKEIVALGNTVGDLSKLDA
ncbi:MAG: glycine--tRNA ligase subunit beta [Bacillota bacterium]|jgi:glycyl-tRNA synthetase beta chain